MMASWLAEAEPATARANRAGGTSPGTNACSAGSSKARAVPMTRTMAKITGSLSQPPALPAASAAAAKASASWQARTTARRS